MPKSHALPRAYQILETLCVPLDAQLFVVLIDQNCGFKGHDWVPNSGPKRLSAALDEASELRRQGWITKMEPL